MANLPITQLTLTQIKMNLQKYLKDTQRVIHRCDESGETCTKHYDSLLDKQEELSVMIVNIDTSLKEINNLPRDTSLDESNM